MTMLVNFLIALCLILVILVLVLLTELKEKFKEKEALIQIIQIMKEKMDTMTNTERYKADVDTYKDPNLN